METEGHPPSLDDSPGQAVSPCRPLLPMEEDSAPSGFTDSTLQSSFPPAVRAEITDCGDPKSTSGEGSGVSPFGSGASGAAERCPRPSAFPSSQAWDSDSEKDTLDEEELQHFCNPHGLAAHSPGPPLRSPSSGHRQDRLEGEIDKVPEIEQHLNPMDNQPSATERWDRGRPTAQGDEPRTEQSGSPDAEGNGDREGATTVPTELLVFEAKPKLGRSKEDRVVLDVYSFPGDSDPDSPPPAPWAHCTFTQRRRKKRALLRPFSGLGSQHRTALGPVRRSKGRECVGPGVGPEVLRIKDERKAGNAGVSVKEEAEEIEKVESEDATCADVFTCVECSIYFKKQVHLQEHMQQHCQSAGRSRWGEGGAQGGGNAGGGLRCTECGWELEDSEALAVHHRQHQESRQKILEEIRKLDEEGAKGEVGNQRGHMHSTGLQSHTVLSRRDPSSSSPSDLSGFRVLGQTALGDMWDEGVQEEQEDCPRTNKDFLKLSQPLPSSEDGPGFQLLSQSVPSHRVGGATKGVPRSFSGPTHSGSVGLCRRDVAFKSTGNQKRGRRRAEGLGVAARVSRALPMHCEQGGAQKQVKTVGSMGQEMTVGSSSHEGSQPATSSLWFPDSAEAPASAVRLKRAFSGRLRGAAEGLGLTLGQQVQLRHMVPFVLIESLRFGPRARFSGTRLGSGDRATDKSEDTDNDDEVVEEDNDSNENDEGNAFLSDDMLGDEGGLLKNVERKCPYCPDRFHNGIGLANHVRGHLNRVGVSYNVRHFISPEEVNAIERKFSYQKKRKKVANFDPDTFSLMRCEFCSAGFDTRAGLSSHARAHLRDFGITNWDVTVSPINILRELFSSRPDLALPMGPPRSSPVDGPELEDDWEPAGFSGVRPVDSTLSSLSPSPESPTPVVSRMEDGDEDQFKEVADVTLVPEKDGVIPSDSEAVDSHSPEEHDATSENGAGGLLKCEVCTATFETRRGLSSHARSHLRQLGVGMSESSGAPIDLLCQLIKERDGRSTSCPAQLSVAKKSQTGGPTARKEPGAAVLGGKGVVSEHRPRPLSPPGSADRAASSSSSPLFTKSRSASPLLKKAPISSLLPASSPLRSLESKPGPGRSPSTSVSSPVASKPFWAPQETDAPLNLTAVDGDTSKDIVCQLCGAWFETRKGLSSHARAHLRHFGVVDAETKGSPIDYLNQLIHTDDFKHRASTLLPELSDGATGVSLPPPSSSSKHPSLSSSPIGLHKAGLARGVHRPKSSASSLLLSPPTKRLKPTAGGRSTVQVFRLSSGELSPVTHGEPVKEIACEFCGEYFENRKGLSSHARSHLRQLGITEWSVNGSPIDTLRELITRRRLPCALPVQPVKSSPSSPGSPRSPPVSPSSPGLLKRLTFPVPHGHQPTARKMAATASLAGLPTTPKSEPVQLEVGAAVSAAGGTGAGGVGSYSPDSVPQSWTGQDEALPLNLAAPVDPEPTRDIRCEFCGEYFENRKGLSSHARSHLRQLGITEWSVNGSPIDTLREVMRKRGTLPAGGVKKEPGVSSGSWDEMAYLPPKFFRKSSLSMVHSGPRVLKHGLGGASISSPPTNGKGAGFAGVSPSTKRLPPEEAHLMDKVRPKAFSPSPLDFSFKGKSSPDKYAGSHSVDASCELCGFYFENRKALASHARAHLRQFGVTEWCVNGSPIETLSAWIRSKPHKAAEMHRRYLQGDRPFPKKKCGASSASLSSNTREGPSSGAHRHLSSQRPALGSPLGRRAGREVTAATWGSAASLQPVPHGFPHQVLPPNSQVARSELNVRSQRGFERRPPKHLSHSESGERDKGPPQPPRTGTIPALVPKPPSTPLVKLVGKIYSLKCRFCEVEFHGPLSVQEDWVRHLQQHILDLNFNKPEPPSTPGSGHTPASAHAPPPAPAPSCVLPQESILLPATPTPVPTSSPTPVPTPTPSASPAASPTPPPVSTPVPVTGQEM